MTAAVRYPGLDALTEHTACVNCGHPVHNTGRGATWIHTLTDTYRCPDYPHGWAEPMLEGDIETRLGEAAAEAEEIGRESGYDDGYDDGYSEGEGEGRDAGYEDGQKDGIAEGREAMYVEMNAALTGCLEQLDGGTFTLAEVRRALTKAWNGVRP